MSDNDAGLDMTSDVLNLLPQVENNRPEVFISARITGSPTAGRDQTSQVLQAVQRALKTEAAMLRIARRADIEPDTLLSLIVRQFDKAAARPEHADFSATEQRALRAAGVDLSGPPTAVDDPAEVTAGRYAVMFSQSLTVAEAARRLSVSAGRIRQRIAARTLLGIRAGGGEWRLPAWQFAGDASLLGLEVVLPSLPSGLHPLAVVGFMTHAHQDLNVESTNLSPIDWLNTGGDPEVVADLARSLPAAA